MTPAACSHQRFLFIFSSFRGLFFKVKVIKMRRILLYHIADEIFIFVIDLDLIGKTGLKFLAPVVHLRFQNRPVYDEGIGVGSFTCG